MIAVIDYGVGNLFSLRRSLEFVGAEATVSGDAAVLRRADKLILPGVGAFGDAAAKLRATGLDQVVLEQAAAGKPLLGICLGMQLLFEESEEYGIHPGLGLLKGRVVAMEGRLPAGLPIPHIGWNGLRLVKSDCPLFRETKDGDCVYFVHSFYAEGCEDSLAATAEYGLDLTATVWRDNVYGCQFHPEKSGPVGLKMLRAFVEV
ncbi:MAG TPA: imidazole glycerol phosphate synthase subunit HisH [Candidatus Avoscillospira avicola]|uniref:Imidazole glycerol phosphate synthase subunit HisH n=1 Tax=Candidatus Avoscillospira avicola TaxID=2840706 RepID=A0A9D1DIX9_9FIRM|nr:imidazole glycerol phosphate synthase subunit HisH [Candidatus Avoscillospira avicola]